MKKIISLTQDRINIIWYKIKFNIYSSFLFINPGNFKRYNGKIYVTFINSEKRLNEIRKTDSQK